MRKVILNLAIALMLIILIAFIAKPEEKTKTISEHSTIKTELKHRHAPKRTRTSPELKEIYKLDQSFIEGQRQLKMPKNDEIEQPEKEATETYELTAYTAGPESTGKHPGHPEYGITASGETVTPGVTIACPPEIELYSEVEIEGIGTRVCHDRGGDIKGKRIDLYIEDLDAALEFGRQNRDIKVK